MSAAGRLPAGPLDRVLAGDAPAFALVHRPDSTGPGSLDVLLGDVTTPDTLAGIPLQDGPGAAPGHEVLAVIPYRQIAERGFACADDGAPLLAMTVTDQAVVGVAEVLARIPEVPLALTGEHFDVDDDAYARMVRRVIAEEIGEGTGANFVIKRSFTAD
ncbi:phenazine-specific anthranilate synthase component I, partial [Streptomyces eurocidicus]|nr:phenazine-specific anthranilate synthase component I [Streptomyces eurocidicus]